MKPLKDLPWRAPHWTSDVVDIGAEFDQLEDLFWGFENYVWDKWPKSSQ
jgi:hypothetical protein